MEMLKGVEVALVHGHAFLHEDFADKLTVVATDNVRTIGSHDH
jgi:hypothetical protein